MSILPSTLGPAAQDALARRPLLARLDGAARARVLERAELRRLPPRTRVHGGLEALGLPLLQEQVARLRAIAPEHLVPFQQEADASSGSPLIDEPAALEIHGERDLPEVPPRHAAFPTAHPLRGLVDRFVSIHPEHVPPTWLLRELIGGSGFEY